MPECPEVTILSDYLNEKLKGKYISSLEVISGKYINKKITGSDLLSKSIKYKVINVSSKGKVLFMKLKHDSTTIYFVSHLGMSGEWSFNQLETDRVRLELTTKKGNLKLLCYNDPRNFGNIEVLDETEFAKKMDKLAPDVLKTNFTNDKFYEMVEEYLKGSKKRYSQSIFKVLTKQNKIDGIISGLGNYLIPEILYNAKISPYRTVGSLSKANILTLAHSIKYITKLSYYNNGTGYMTNFGDYSENHKKGIDSGKYANYHDDIKLGKTDEFTFKIYQQTKDPLGNLVEKDKTLNKGRTTHWVKTVQV